MSNSIFANIDRQKVGACYHNWSMVSADFETPIKNVRRLMPSEKLKPIQTKAGLTSVTLMGMTYPKVEYLAPYNEFGVLIPVEPIVGDQDEGIPIYYVFQLPVTTHEACNSGLMFFGYPKFVAEIGFENKEKRVHCRVKAEGQDIVFLEVHTLPLTGPASNYYTYSFRKDTLLKTLIQIQGQSGKITNDTGARYFLGKHPIANELAKLEMNRVAVSYQYAPQLQSILHLPVKL